MRESFVFHAEYIEDLPEEYKTRFIEYTVNYGLSGNGIIVQICEETGNDYDSVKDAVKMIAVEQLAYPYTTIGGKIIPQRERDCSVEECSKLIEAAQMLAADLGIIVRYGE